MEQIPDYYAACTTMLRCIDFATTAQAAASTPQGLLTIQKRVVLVRRVVVT